MAQVMCANGDWLDLPDDWTSNGYHCLHCGEDYPEAQCADGMCPQGHDLETKANPAIFSTEPLLGDEQKDQGHWHAKHDQYIYELSLD